MCVSFECDSLSEELGEEKETESSGRGFYFSRASQVMGLVLVGISVDGIGLGLAMFRRASRSKVSDKNTRADDGCFFSLLQKIQTDTHRERDRDNIPEGRKRLY